MPGPLTARSTSSPTRAISARSAPNIFTPTGVRMPVVSMSMRSLMGMVQALVVPGIWTARSSSATNSSQEMRSGQTRRRRAWTGRGVQEEYQRCLGRHSAGGFSTMVVSIMEKGAGSVEVSARPSLAKNRNHFRERGDDLVLRGEEFGGPA